MKSVRYSEKNSVIRVIQPSKVLSSWLTATRLFYYKSNLQICKGFCTIWFKDLYQPIKSAVSRLEHTIATVNNNEPLFHAGISNTW